MWFFYIPLALVNCLPLCGGLNEKSPGWAQIFEYLGLSWWLYWNIIEPVGYMALLKEVHHCGGFVSLWSSSTSMAPAIDSFEIINQNKPWSCFSSEYFVTALEKWLICPFVSPVHYLHLCLNFFPPNPSSLFSYHANSTLSHPLQPSHHNQSRLRTQNKYEYLSKFHWWEITCSVYLSEPFLPCSV